MNPVNGFEVKIAGGAQSGQILTIGDGVMVNGLGIITVKFLVAVNRQPYWSFITSVMMGLIGFPVNAWFIGLVTPVVGGISPNVQLYEMIPDVKLLLNELILSLQSVAGPRIIKAVFGKLKVNVFVSVQPFLEMVKVIVGLHPMGTNKVGFGILLPDKVAQGLAVHRIE